MICPKCGQKIEGFIIYQISTCIDRLYYNENGEYITSENKEQFDRDVYQIICETCGENIQDSFTVQDLQNLKTSDLFNDCFYNYIAVQEYKEENEQ